MQDSFDKGFKMGRQWEGPNGDGSMGVLSQDFVREQAEMHAAGFRFAEMNFVSDEERDVAAAFMRGFYAGRGA